MTIARRDFLKAASALAAAFGLRLVGSREALAKEGGSSVIWLQAQGCTGCSVSLLNSLTKSTVEDLLLYTLDLNFHPTVMAAAGPNAVAAANAARDVGNYILVVEGAIPTGAGGRYCHLWPGVTAQQGVLDFAAKAKYIVACGTCACFGGIPASVPPGKTNPTGAKGVGALVTGKTIINVAGCPPHPDWIVGTIASLIGGTVPELDGNKRPKSCYVEMHDKCPFKEDPYKSYCLERYGCKGPITRANCHVLKWNNTAAGAKGVNWCMGARSPCQGCTQPNFPDGMLPFSATVDD